MYLGLEEGAAGLGAYLLLPMVFQKCPCLLPQCNCFEHHSTRFLQVAFIPSMTSPEGIQDFSSSEGDR